MKAKPILVFKVGTASITKSNGDLDQAAMVDITRQLATLHSSYHIIMVSSGAVGNGKNYIENYQGDIIERKAAAAIGNPLLMNKYMQFFAPYEIFVAQSLCERQHFTRPSQFEQLKSTFKELWKNGIIPIANENDVVSNLELKFSDNDELATLLAVGFGADLLLIGTSVDGVYDAKGAVIPEIRKIDEQILGLARDERSGLGLGGMSTKLTFARLATQMGIKTIIFNSRQPDAIINAIGGKTGTLCHAGESTPEERQRWLASGNLVRGRVSVNSQAALKLRSLQGLSKEDVVNIMEHFKSGEIFEIFEEGENSIAVARARVSSREIIETDPDISLEIAQKNEIILL